MSIVYFIRHGQASFGSSNYDRLSDLGKRQAMLLRDYFRRQDLTFHAAYTGEMERQKQTADIALDGNMAQGCVSRPHVFSDFNEHDTHSILKAQIPKMLEEDPSLTEDLPKIFSDIKAFERIFESGMQRWAADRNDMAGMENWPAFNKRVRNGVRRVMKENGSKKRVAVFTSGGPLCVVMQMALDLSDETALRLPNRIRNSSVSAFLFQDTRFNLLSFNSVAHLEREGESGLITYH